MVDLEKREGIASAKGAIEGTLVGRVRPARPRSQWQAQDRRDTIPVLGFREYWYPALPAKMVGKRPRPWKMLGETLVFFRGKERGSVACISSVCAHRGGNLAEGECHWPGTISCPYHGWTYNERGEVVTVLSEGPNSLIPDAGVKGRAYPTQVLKGLAFVWMGAAEPVPIEEDVPPEFFMPEAHVKVHLEYWKSNWRRGVENAADAHAPYVHRNSFRMGQHPMSFAGPVGERVKLVNGRAAVMAGYAAGAPRAMSGRVKQYFPKVGHHWPKSRWRRLWTWLFGWGRKRAAKVPPLMSRVQDPSKREEWGGVLQHFPSMIRRDNGGYVYTRNNVAVTEELSRQVYYHWDSSTNWLGRLWENLHWNTFHNWMHYTNFSRQDLRAVINQSYVSEEYFSSNDSPLVAWRKLCTMSRDAQRIQATLARAVEEEVVAGTEP